jgi:hypothetical protein
MKTNLNIVNDVTCKYANFYYEILCIVGYTKITKSDKTCRFKINILRSRRLKLIVSIVITNLMLHMEELVP